jgi:predicted transcriptional regulator
MTRPPITVDADTSLDKVVHLMEWHHIKRLPVLRKGKVVGVISRANLMRALASIHHASSKTSRNDQEIRKRIVADIAAHQSQDFSHAAADITRASNDARALGGIERGRQS